MDDFEAPVAGPPIEAIDPVFHVYETRVEDNRLLYYGEPEVSEAEVLEEVWSVFHERGYSVELRSESRETLLVAEPIQARQGVPWIPVALTLATVVATLWAGTTWYYVRNPLVDPLGTVLTVWPFPVAVLGVLGVHELAHYLASRRHQVDASLPYFIPLPTIIGTLGAVIVIRGRIPNRRALFDIGASGPLAGLVAAIVVSVIGLLLPPVAVPEWAITAEETARPVFGYPLLLQGLATALEQPLTYQSPTEAANPVLFGGWVGMFVTFLNLLPVGQLDGGHIIRAVLGARARWLAVAVPLLLFGLAGYLFLRVNAFGSAALWAVWGVLSLALVFTGTAEPVNEAPLGAGRRLLAGLTLVAAVVCFTPIPIRVV